MRKITLLSVALGFASVCVAQSADQSEIRSKADEFNSDSKAYVKKYLLQKEGERASIMRPAREEEWLYESEWYKGGDYFYSYDAKGNILNEIYEDESGKTVSDYLYDDNNQKVSETVSLSENGGELANSSKRITIYDSVVTDFVAESESYTWDSESAEWNLIADGHTWKKVITRNDKNKVASIELHNYFMGEYHLQMRTTVSYNDDGLACEWKYEELGYNDLNELVMQEVYLFTDMEWYTTDGQILVLNDPSDFYAPGNNRLKKAAVYERGVKVYDVTASYEENGNYTLKKAYADGSRDLLSHTFTDDNGSYISRYAYCLDIDGNGEVTDDEELFAEELTVTIDACGRITAEKAVGIEDGEEELIFAAKYDYTYTDESGDYPVEQIFSEYDFDAEDYVPFLKIIGKDFSDVSGVGSIMPENKAETAIFNLQGIRIDADKNSLPAGIYIIRQNGKTEKVAITR